MSANTSSDEPLPFDIFTVQCDSWSTTARKAPNTAKGAAVHNSATLHGEALTITFHDNFEDPFVFSVGKNYKITIEELPSDYRKPEDLAK